MVGYLRLGSVRTGLGISNGRMVRARLGISSGIAGWVWGVVGYHWLGSVTTWLGIHIMAKLGTALLCISRARLGRGIAGWVWWVVDYRRLGSV